MSPVTMQDLELEHAELLPSRETLWASSCGCHGHGSTTTIVGSFDGNTYQSGISNVSVLNGNFDGSNFLNL
jgi:hypothetical protein